MNNQSTFSHVAAISAILPAPMALLSTFIAIYAVGFDFELLDEPVGLISLGARTATLFRWSWILAGFGFYLLLVPAVLYLQSWLNSQEPNLVRLYTVFGLGYCFIGMFNYFLGPIWAAWLGIVVWRGAAQHEPALQSVTAV